MNFTRFSPSTTYIFPQVNGTSGGQILSEYNLRVRESVATNPDVPYMIGPSYTHSMQDFAIGLQSDDIGVISSTTLQISSGRALVNGHFIDSVVPVIIDINTVNANLGVGETPLNGTLCVGLRAMYSSDPNTFGTLMGSIDTNGYFEGIQVVILPKSDFVLPSSDAGIRDASMVNAHLKLGEFTFINGAISPNSIIQNVNKVQVLDASRVGQIEQTLSGKYVTADTLNPANLYVMSGDGRWCKSNEALMVWDDSQGVPKSSTDENPIILQPTGFVHDAIYNDGIEVSDTIKLNITHKQIDGLKDTYGNPMYIPDIELPIPVADYDQNTGGTVDVNYTKKLKSAVRKLDDIHRSVAGKQVWYLDTLTDVEDLPTIETLWNIGDYVLVRQDQTVKNFSSDIAQYPSTMYVIVYGQVTGIYSAGASTDKPETNGIQLGGIMEGTADPWTLGYDPNSGYIYYRVDDNTKTLWNVNYLNGVPEEDYFCYRWKQSQDDEGILYYVLVSSAKMVYSNAIILTGTIPYATESLVGGFLNVKESDNDRGYVYLDEEGHLRLLDYGLLRTGTLAYQLGADVEIPAGLSIEEIQLNLDEYVNDRVAFPTEAQITQALSDEEPTDVIRIDITISDDALNGEAKTINIQNIDSRFGTSVYLSIHSTTSLDSNLTINIINCEKIRIDNNILGVPTINIINSCLYYDSVIFGKINYAEDLSIWYARYDDGIDLIVDGMEVYSPNVTSISNIDTMAIADEGSHYRYAVRGITFDSHANIVGMSIFFMANITASGGSEESLPGAGEYIFTAPFKLSSSIYMPIPIDRLNKSIKIIGIHSMAYPMNVDAGYVFAESNFSIITQNSASDTGMIGIKQTISYITNSVSSIPTIQSGEANVLDCWQADSYSVYEGYTYG